MSPGDTSSPDMSVPDPAVVAPISCARRGGRDRDWTRRLRDGGRVLVPGPEATAPGGEPGPGRAAAADRPAVPPPRAAVGAALPTTRPRPPRVPTRAGAPRRRARVDQRPGQPAARGRALRREVRGRVPRLPAAGVARRGSAARRFGPAPAPEPRAA